MERLVYIKEIKDESNEAFSLRILGLPKDMPYNSFLEYILKNDIKSVYNRNGVPMTEIEFSLLNGRIQSEKFLKEIDDEIKEEYPQYNFPDNETIEKNK